jgi:hypothetical protein
MTSFRAHCIEGIEVDGQGLGLRQAAMDVGGVSAAEFDAWVDLQGMSAPDQGQAAGPATS